MKHIGNPYSKGFNEAVHQAKLSVCPESYPHSVIELGTYLTIQQQVELFRNAGINLQAYREAVYDFANGIADYRLELAQENPDYFGTLDADTAEMLTKKMANIADLQLQRALKEDSDKLEAEQKATALEAQKKEAFEKWLSQVNQQHTVAEETNESSTVD